MDITCLPPPAPAPGLAFSDKAGARAWLAAQPQADPLPMLQALAGQLRAIDAASLTVDAAQPLISVLRRVAVPLLLTVDGRLIRKAVPLHDGDQQLHDASAAVWTALATVDLRLAAGAAVETAAPSLWRAAMAVRHGRLACIQAAQSMPAAFDHLLLHTLHLAVRHDCLSRELPDPDFADLGSATIGSELIWAILLDAVDPYRLTPPQLAVAQRALRRWRTLLAFSPLPAEDVRAPQLSLARLFPACVFAGEPAWIDLRPVLRKLRQRLAALEAGETPESLKLGNELSASACRRLLEDMAQSLRQPPTPPVREAGHCELVFGSEHAYAYFKHRILNKTRADVRVEAVAKQRMEIFGFDYLSQLPGERAQVAIPSESWQRDDGCLRRPVAQGSRRQSPALVAGLDAAGQPRLGCLQGLVADPQQLTARVRWFPGETEASHIEGVVKHGQPIPRFPVFVLLSGTQREVVAPPAAGLAVGATVRFAESDGPAPLILGEVIERGVDFVRYAAEPA